ncbi:MAG: eCIS core domain-containing protein, partial [Mucilaginibacter sp.]
MEKLTSIPGQHSNTNVAHSGFSLNRERFFQPKLAINEPGDVYEQEADAMADKVMHMPASSSQSFFKPATTAIQRKCKDCEEEDQMLQRKGTDANPMADGHDLDKYGDTLDSSGQPLTNASRQMFEPRFGYDFSDVRVHTDNEAAKSAKSVNALAYATGNHIVFNQGQYTPDSGPGQKLMAHELTHVVQQNNGMVSPKRIQRQDEKPDEHPLQITKRLELPAPDMDLPKVLASPENKKEDEKPHLGIDFSKGVSANPPLALRPETYSFSL